MLDHSQRWILLGILALAQFMVVLDVSIMNVALPSVQRSLHLSLSNLQWIVTIYTLAFGGFLLLGGRAADLYGRRTVFVSGVFAFSAISLLVGLSQSDIQIIILRGFQGLSAAFMSPAALSIVLTTFREPAERTRALSVWGMVAAGGGAFGVLLGGILTQYLSWRWNFFINVPIGIFVGLLALRLAPPHEFEETTKSLDLPGAVLITSGLILLVYTLSQASTWGWYSGQTLFFLGGVLALFIAFVVNEYYASHPLVPLSVFSIGNITPANMTQLPITAALFAMFFFISLYVQTVLGYTPVMSGLSFLPVPLIVAISAMLAPRALMRVGYRPILIVAPLLMAAGLFILSHVPVAGSYWSDVLPGMAIMAVGMGFSFVSLTVAATTGIPMHQSGLASGLLNTSQQIGGAVGLAILSSVAASKTAAMLAIDSTSPLAQVSATVAGFQSAFAVGVAFAFLASFFALVLIRDSSDHSSTSIPVVFE